MGEELTLPGERFYPRRSGRSEEHPKGRREPEKEVVYLLFCRAEWRLGSGGMGRVSHLLASVPPAQFRHLPMSFHLKQEELKFNTALRRLQHRVGEARLLREALQQGTEAGQGGGQHWSPQGFWAVWK